MHHIGTHFTKPPLLAPSHSPLKTTVSEQNGEFQQVNRQLSGEHSESNMGSLSAEPPPSAPSHFPLKATVKVRFDKPDMCDVERLY